MTVHLNDLSGVYLDQILEKKKEKPLDPVGQEDGDVDNDGDEDSSDEYLKKRREAISKAIGDDKEDKEDKDKKDKKDCKKEEVEVIGEEGKKDACYHKVKARYSVWPSAYASGALVKCRKKGAKNWGNKTKKEEFELNNEAIGEANMEGAPSIKDAKPAKKTNVKYDRHMKVMAPQVEKVEKEEVEQVDEKCWKGYKKKGMKTMFGKRYPNCVKEDVENVIDFFIEEGFNEYGLEIFIEEIGLESFADYFYDTQEVLSEARAGGVRVEPVTKSGKSIGSLKGGAKTSAINRLRKEKQARRDAESSSSKPSGMKAALRSQSATASKPPRTQKGAMAYDGPNKRRSEAADRVSAKTKAKQSALSSQPKKTAKKGVMTRIAMGALNQISKGIERHNIATGSLKAKNQKAATKNRETYKKMGKKLGLSDEYSDWRSDLTETLGEGVLIEVEKKNSKMKSKSDKIGDGNVNNSSCIQINPEFKEGIEYLGGTILEFTEVSEKKEAPTPQQRLNRDAGKIAAKKVKQRDHERAVNFLPYDEEVQSVANTNEDGVEIDENKSGDSSLHDWFSKSRSSDGRPGWVQLGGRYAGKPCARQPGQKTKPKCGSSQMAANLDDEEEEKAFKRKNRKDPNPDREGKAINVPTEGYRVISTSFKHGDGHPDDDITIKREKKVVSGDNLTKKGAKRSQERRGREYGSQGAFQVQKTREAKKRSSNAPSVDKVKADINKKEKQREKTSYNRKIDGMNRAGTPSGKVAAARLRGMKRLNNSYEVDSPFVVEKKMTKPQKDKKEEIVDSMSETDFERRYPGRGKEVMYATATKLAQKCSESASSFDDRKIDPKQNPRKNERNYRIGKAGDTAVENGERTATKRGIATLPPFANKKPKVSTTTEELSIDQQMKIARDAAKDRNPNPDHKKIRGNMLRKPLPKDTRTDAKKMTDATGPRDAFGRPAKSGYSGG